MAESKDAMLLIDDAEATARRITRAMHALRAVAELPNINAHFGSTPRELVTAQLALVVSEEAVRLVGELSTIHKQIGKTNA